MKMSNEILVVRCGKAAARRGKAATAGGCWYEIHDKGLDWLPAECNRVYYKAVFDVPSQISHSRHGVVLVLANQRAPAERVGVSSDR